MHTQTILSDLLEAYANGHKNRTALYSDVATRLSAIAHKAPPWGVDYIQAVAAGTLAASKKFTHAVEVLAAEVDGTPAVITDTEPVTIHARPGAVRPGALFVGESRNCKYPPCTIHFIRTHPRQVYCPLHRNPATRRGDPKSRK